MTTCPPPHPPGDRVLLAHGEGARLTRRLIRDVILAELGNPLLDPLADAAALPELAGRPVLATDGFVVSPLFFPGGDVGRLAVHGTLNDLAVAGAEPLYLTLALIIEEGFALADLRRVVAGVGAASRACGVPVVAGDTKVVPRGAADGLFVTTTGLGVLPPGRDLGPHRARPGDRILVSGTLGDHGITVLAARERLGLDAPIRSDTAPVVGLVRALFAAGVDVRFLRDPTRGGVSAVLHELAQAAGLSAEVDEASVPVAEPVRAACELLGLDPLYVANEGKLVAVVPAADAARALACLRADPLGANAANVGEIMPGPPDVRVRSPFGALRMLDEPSGAPLPRIC